MEKVTYNEKPSLRENLQYKGVKSSMIVQYYTEKGRDTLSTIPTKEDLIRAIDQLPSFQSKQ